MTIDVSETLREPDYGPFNLKCNPFPMTAIASGGSAFPFSAEDAEKIIEEFINRTFFENQYAGMLVVGDFGFGKTFTLRFIEKNINERYSQRNSEAACAIYIENPHSNPRELISAIISRYGTSKYLTLLWRIVTKEFRKHFENGGYEFLNSFRKTQIGIFDRDVLVELLFEERIMDPMRLIRRISDSFIKTKDFKIEKFSEFAYENVISKIFGNTDVAQALCKFNPLGFNASLRDWSSMLEYRAKKPSAYVGSDDIAYMHSVFDVFKANGFKRIYLLIDEFEDIHENAKKIDLNNYLRTLRDFIDSNKESIAIVIALKREVVKSIELAYGGFKQRFPIRYIVDLAGVMKTSINMFIEKILEKERLNEENNKCGTYPFTDSALDKLYELVGPNPRLILQTCSELLYGCAINQVENIDIDFIEDYYSSVAAPETFAQDKVWITKKVAEKIQEGIK